MPDLVIHIAAARILLIGSRIGAPWRALFYLANCLPDVLYRAFSLGTASHDWYAEAAHTPLVQAVWAYALALTFREDLRARAWLALTAGMWLHDLLDMSKDALDRGVVLWAFPFSVERSRIGFLVSEESLDVSAGCLALLLILELLQRRRRGAASS